MISDPMISYKCAYASSKRTSHVLVTIPSVRILFQAAHLVKTSD
ncbi:hypothetical protein HanPSC8_Chr01g0015811 [Helianthus annuus]|nr:hypothetical protein HanPSC8_Chr01g0015811 [Helianthus annuus]